MKTLSTQFCRSAAAAAVLFLASPAAMPQDALQPAAVPASVAPLPLPRDAATPAEPNWVAVAAAEARDNRDNDVTEEVVVQGRSNAFLRDRLERAEDKLYQVYNDINTIEEFDIGCRQHAQTGTRMVQRVCVPNYEKTVSARKGQAVLAAMRGEAFGTDWQVHENTMKQKNVEILEHMQALAEQHPEFLDALIEVYEAMQSAQPRRYASEP